MRLTLSQLEQDLKDRFGKEDSAFYFGIEDTTYRNKNKSLYFKVFHYRDNKNNRVYQLTFDKVELCRIGEENYNPEFEEEVYEGFAFFWQIKNSRFKKDFNSWSSYEAIYGIEKYNNLKSYRVIGQNNFIDVLTTENPIIEVIEDNN